MNTLLQALRASPSKSSARLVLVLTAFVVALGGTLRSEEVDTEFLLLVDTSVVVSAGDFSNLMSGYAAAFQSTSVLDAMTAGERGRTALSVVFFGGVGTPAVVVPWMSISDTASASAFAAALTTAARPTPQVAGTVAGALDFATQQFGFETGQLTGNGFESNTQSITMTSETFSFGFFADAPGAVEAASTAAVAAGVDVINGIAVETFFVAGGTNYYNTNVVGGSAGGVPGALTPVGGYANLTDDATIGLTGQFASLVPEPGSVTLAILGLAGFCLRRRRA